MTRILFTLLLFIGSIALFLYYTKPAYDSMRSTQEDIAQYDAALSKADELQRLKQQLLSRYNAFNPADIERLRKLLPDHVDNVRLVLDLDTLASKYGFALQNVVIDAQGLVPIATDVAVIGADESPTGSLTLKFATGGSYPQFVEFMQALEDSLRVVDLVELSMDPDTSAQSNEPVYRFDVTLRTYWLK